MKKVKNIKLLIGVEPGAKRFTPVSVANDQLLCLPEPLMLANGFSCIKTRNLWRRATFSIKSMNKELWSTATFASSNTGANSYCAGATRCDVFLQEYP